MTTREKWEYLTFVLYADLENPGAKEVMNHHWPDWKNPPRYTPQALMPELNRMGETGWELIHIERVNDSVYSDAIFKDNIGAVNAYFCVFKRKVIE